MFGSSPAPAPTPPPLPDPLPATPQYASGGARPTPRGKPYGGTLLTSPLGMPEKDSSSVGDVPTARKSLLGT